MFEKFQSFQNLVETATKEKIATLRTDNGGEFTSNHFLTYCQEKGIKRQLTNFYTPQQNGVSERMNQTLLGMARAMLFFKGLKSCYWAEAVHTAVYLRNRSPSSSLDGITPFEAWYGFKPMVKHLRVFGSVCYALVPKEKRKKLESRSVKCMLIGYSNEKKGYRLLSDGKFIVSRDVIFDETESLSVEEVEKQLSHLEEKVTKEQLRMQHLNKTRNDSLISLQNYRMVNRLKTP